MSKEDRELWRDEPIPPPEKRPTLQWPLVLGDGTGSLDDEEAPYTPALIVNGQSVFNFLAKFMGNVRIHGQMRATSALIDSSLELAGAYLQFQDVDAHPGWETLPSLSYGCNVYTKVGKLIIQVCTGSTEGSVHYWYLDITGTSATWTYSATAP